MIGDSIDVLICPEGHSVPYARWNYAKELSKTEVDAMTLLPVYESGLYCSKCDKPYGLSKLTKPQV